MCYVMYVLLPRTRLQSWPPLFSSRPLAKVLKCDTCCFLINIYIFLVACILCIVRIVSIVCSIQMIAPHAPPILALPFLFEAAGEGT
jgi:hypothetical protein